jgi:phospholipase/carboxylesterase
MMGGSNDRDEIDTSATGRPGAFLPSANDKTFPAIVHVGSIGHGIVKAPISQCPAAMTTSSPAPDHASGLWLELPPSSATAPPRLIVFLHGAGSTPEAMAPAAVAWMLKFPGATGAIMHGLVPAAAGGFDWHVPSNDAAQAEARIIDAGNRLAQRIAHLQQTTGLAGAQTVVVGFSQGATLALELARRHADQVGIVVACSGRMIPSLKAGEAIRPAVHLIHGLLDTVTPVAHARQAYGRLRGAGASVTLDLIEDLGHGITQDVIILGTTRALQTIFSGRRIRIRKPGRQADQADASMTATLHPQKGAWQ